MVLFRTGSKKKEKNKGEVDTRGGGPSRLGRRKFFFWFIFESKLRLLVAVFKRSKPPGSRDAFMKHPWSEF